ncbi:protocadherin-18b isoform X1 [Electrophorus electricus]|uniref:protocadherin-18b isoform X1 n=1 Tax=Electrophorus electricus TaxID=8005 RepID=UPI0015D040FB|nr:protocadherin-18b isoform X1 [Electrophorus electricus]
MAKQSSKRNVLFFTTFLKLAVVTAVAGSVSGKTLKYKVLEEQRIGTVIARLREDVAGALAKLPSSVSPRFRAVQRGSTPSLLLREEDGEISIGSKIDREKLCEKNLNCTIEFDVITLPREYLQLFHVQVEVLDINDNAPQFARAVIPVQISESASVGTRFPLDSAADPDVGDNALHTYSLTRNHFFKIDIRTRTDGAKYADLVVVRELDRETQSSYQLQLSASDSGVPPRSGSTLLKISILDSNDNSPAFDEQAYVVELLENSPLGTLLVDLNATDPDEGNNGKIIYSFSSHVSPKILETFKINPENGQITLMKKVDYETTSSYELDIQAQDMGPNSIPGHCKIIIKVVDVNDNKPRININLMAQGREEVAYISEAAPPDTFIALVRVDDSDSGPNGEVACRLHGHGHFRLLKTYENNYMILTNVSLDREKRSEFSLTVIAEDGGSPSLSTIKHFTVQVQDENDNPPHFEKSHYEIFRSENNLPGAYLTSVVATDPDLGPNGQVTYSMVDSAGQDSSASTYVTIDPSSGAVYALQTFDREEVGRLVFTVQARDGGGGASLSTNATVVLTVLDENDNAPVIVSPPLSNHTAEVALWRQAEPGHLVTVIKATDRDAGANGELTCAIMGGNEARLFVMEPRQCELRTNGSVEGAGLDVFDLSVLVQDRGTVARLSTSMRVRVLLQEGPDTHLLTPSDPTGQTPLDVSMIIIVSLGAICGVLLVVMVMFAMRCSRDQKDPRHSYNCRVAESTYQNHPKKPARQIHKGDITLVPTVNGTLPVRAHACSPSASPAPESRRNHHSRQSLNSLVTISSNHVPENFSLELTQATPPVERVSQLLSMLHQGQYQPRPSFRGNKYTRSYRSALNEMDKFSLKDSGRGDSEAGDSDCEMGRESPLLGELGELFTPDGQHRLHPVMKLCTEECRVLGHSDQCWMPPLTSPASSDYRSNLYIPGEDHPQSPTPEATQSGDSTLRKKSFSTFGKESEEDEAQGEDSEKDEDLCGTSSLLSEMSSVFQRLLPSSLDAYIEASEAERVVVCPVGVGSLERRRGHLPGKPSPASYQQDVAAWAANTHFQNPGHSHAPASHMTAPVPPLPAPLPAPVSASCSKWLPAMEEIPENREEDELEAVLSHLQGKHGDSHSEIVDASELVAEINKLLQDVRQS